MESEQFVSLGAAVEDARFCDVDVALRRGRHVDREDNDWFAYLLDAQGVLESFYRRYGCELVYRSDGYFFLLPTADKLPKRQLSVAEMIVGQAAALLYLDPRTVETQGTVARDDVLSHLATVMGADALVHALAGPRRRRADERVAQETVRSRVAEALRKLATLGFVELTESERVRLRPALMRFAEPVRTADSPAAALEKLVASGEIALGANADDGADIDDVEDAADAEYGAELETDEFASARHVNEERDGEAERDDFSNGDFASAARVQKNDVELGGAVPLGDAFETRAGFASSVNPSSDIDVADKRRTKARRDAKVPSAPAEAVALNGVESPAPAQAETEREESLAVSAEVAEAQGAAVPAEVAAPRRGRPRLTPAKKSRKAEVADSVPPSEVTAAKPRKTYDAWDLDEELPSEDESGTAELVSEDDEPTRVVARAEYFGTEVEQSTLEVNDALADALGAEFDVPRRKIEMSELDLSELDEELSAELGSGVSARKPDAEDEA